MDAGMDGDDKNIDEHQPRKNVFLNNRFDLQPFLALYYFLLLCNKYYFDLLFEFLSPRFVYAMGAALLQHITADLILMNFKLKKNY
jgi:hypothetical protein